MERMADSASESDSGSVDGSVLLPPSPISRDQLQKRIDSLAQQNRVLKVELETYKFRVKALQEENHSLKQASVNIQARAEQEEEYISNTLLKKIQALKKEKETLAINYEQEEESLTNDLSRKLNQLRSEKQHLEHTLEQEQECLVNKLMNKIQKLENETLSKQASLEQLRREKVELENTLEQEQEALVNKLWKKMEKLESEKRMLCVKLERPGMANSTDGFNSATNTPPNPNGTARASCVSSLPAVHPSTPGPALVTSLSRRHQSASLSPGDASVSPVGGVSAGGGVASVGVGGATAADLSLYIQQLRREVAGLKEQLHNAQKEHAEKMVQYAKEEQQICQENQRMQKQLQHELERRESLCRNLSESESSLEMDEERQSELGFGGRCRTISSPGPSSLPSPGCSRPISPGPRELHIPGPPLLMRCYHCGATQPVTRSRGPLGPPATAPSCSSGTDKFVKPAAPAVSMTFQPASSPSQSMQMSPTPARSATPTEQAASPLTVPGSPMDTSHRQ